MNASQLSQFVEDRIKDLENDYARHQARLLLLQLLFPDVDEVQMGRLENLLEEQG